MQILQIISSARGAEPYSTRLSQGVVLGQQPGRPVVVHNLVAYLFPHLELHAG